ncbi:WXG100 family type VII secretion target [Mycobacterium sp. Marseille-P9652]|uniref:WXG100 family type VII secretion target n=1 Tax=Mycobacterium sp. Marseille-P9652 TaxID=2654950 RepID=UPI0021030404|nr:WXG100 family type VII secretion target [Mycobacterium sp. Marseille-P9652]
MAGEGALRVDPAVMQSFAASVGGAAEQLLAQLTELDEQVGKALGGWSGGAGSAYGSAWELWHRGAQEVRVGLAMLAHRAEQAGGLYERNEAAAAREMREVYRG